DIVDQFLNDNGLAHTCPAKRPNLTTPHEWGDQVNYFNTCLKDLNGCCLVFQIRSRPMNRQAWRIGHFRFVINWLPQPIKDASQRLVSYWNRDGLSRINCLNTAL